MIRTIQSLENPKIKTIRSLHMKKYRNKLNKYLIEGKRIVKEAIKHHIPIDAIVLSATYLNNIQDLDRVMLENLKDVEILQVTDKVFHSLTTTKTPQGILAVVSKKSLTLPESLKKLPDKPFIITLDNLQDPGNMGTIIRTAEAAGADLILVSKESTDPFGDKALRASMGAAFLIPVIEVEGTEYLKTLDEVGVVSVATDLTAEKEYTDLNFCTGINVIIGNEAHGVTQEVLSKVMEKVIIPIDGSIDSLNASIAAGILIYKVREKRSAKHKL